MDVGRLNDSVRSPEEALQWASDNLHPRVAKASSFGAEDAVITDMMVKINPEFRFVTLDTGRLPQETYDAMDAARKRYGMRLEVLFPDPGEVSEMVNSRGLNLFYDSAENRMLCCQVRKTRPFDRFVSGLDGWITGLRRRQAGTRSQVRMFETDSGHGGIVKINPLADWTQEMVWDYIKKHDVPYNALLDRGYASIGCAPCTRAVGPGEDERSGRWWWESGSHKECGLHLERA